MNFLLFFLVNLFTLSFPYTLSSRSQFRVFNLFFDYINEVMAYDIDDSHITLFTRNKLGYIISLTTFETELMLNLTNLNENLTNTDNFDPVYKTLMRYPRGLFYINSIFFLFELENKMKTSHKLHSFINSDIKDFDFIDKEKILVWNDTNPINLYNFSSFGENITIDLSKNLQISQISQSQIQIISFYDELSNKTEYFILNTRNKKTRKLESDFILPFIKETIEKSIGECMSEVGFENELDIDFEIDLNYFLLTCKAQVFIFAFVSAYQQNFSINHIFYRNTVERMFIYSTNIKIIEGTSLHLMYSIYSFDAICYYLYEPYQENLKYFSNKRILCMKNSVINARIENVHYNKENNYVNIFMRNGTDGTVFFPSFHKCVLNMHTTNFICQICNSFYCPKQCERYQYPGCSFVGEVQRTFFVVLTMMIIFSIGFLCCAHICKNRENLCGLLIMCFQCFYMMTKKTLCFISVLWSIQCRRKLKYVRSYGVYWCKWGFRKFYWCKCGFRKLEDEQNCPICLENINNRPKMFFACGRHEVHADCFSHYVANNQQNNTKEGCPFRDA